MEAKIFALQVSRAIFSEVLLSPRCPSLGTSFSSDRPFSDFEYKSFIYLGITGVV